jgi:hypothetical protein
MIVEALILQKSPQDFATAEMRILLENVQTASDALFRGNLDTARNHVDIAKASLASCVDYASKANPINNVVLGPRTQFKFDMYNRAIAAIRGILADFEMVLLASNDWVPLQRVQCEISGLVGTGRVRVDELSSLHEILGKTRSFKSMEQSLTRRMENTFKAVLVILEHSSEERIEDECVQQVEGEGVATVDGADMLYKELSRSDSLEATPKRSLDDQQLTSNKHARLSAVVSAFQSAARHCGELAVLCLEECV